MYVDVLGLPDSWRAYARDVKTKNEKRRVFQEECTRIIPGWERI